MRAFSIRMLVLTAMIAVTATTGCGPEEAHSDRREAGSTALAAARPSFLLVVVDTLRADAVSAYGAVAGTTPHIDALAAEGLRYTRAFAPAPWTLPSHATLFAGVGPERHGVGVGGRVELPGDLPLLAEQLAAGGYETIGFSENPLVSQPFGLTRGFESFANEGLAEAARASGWTEDHADIVEGVSSWADRRPAARPFFVFVNLFDPHDPYTLHEEHLFLPDGADRGKAETLSALSNAVGERLGMCDLLPPERDLAILRGLYLGEVATADAKLAAIYRAVASAARGPLITIVTADHGEHLGEHRLLGHQFSLRTQLLHVPLVVHGVPGAKPAVVDSLVTLADLAPSIVSWASAAVPDGWTGRTLPEARREATGERTLFAAFSDVPPVLPKDVTKLDLGEGRRRRSCGPQDRVFAEILSLTHYPYKLIWYERYPPELYDLSWDPDERSDVATHHAELTAQLVKELESYRDLLATRSSSGPGASPDPRAHEALRALGYVE